MIQKKRSNRRKTNGFKPNRAFIAKATEFFISNGGRITKLEFKKQDFEVFVASSEPGVSVDEFLNGG